MFFTTISFGQNWNKLSDISNNVTIKQIETSNDGKIYVLTDENYPFFSEDGGANWQAFVAPPNSTFLLNAKRMYLNKTNQRVFFGTSFTGISYTSNLGSTWGQEFFSTSLPSGLHEGIHQMASSNDTIIVSGDFSFSGSIQRYFYSTNNGNTWSTVFQGTGIAEDMIYHNSKLIVVTSQGLKTSTDFGATWNVLAFSNSATFRCWSIVNANANGYYCVVYNIPMQQHQIYQSNDLSTWNLTFSFNTAFGHYNDVSYAPQSNSLLLATREGLIQYDLSTNTAATISTEQISDAEEAITTTAILYGTDYNIGVRTASEPSFSWVSLTNGLHGFGSSNFLLNNSKFFSISSAARLVSIKPNLGLNNWNFSLPTDPNNIQNPINSYLKKNSAGIYVGGNTNIFKSTDDGVSWISITTENVMPFNSQGQHNFSYFNTTKNNQLYISMDNDNGVLRRSTDNGSSWSTCYSSFSALRYSNVVSDGNLLVYASYFTNGLQNKLIKSTDGGNTWTDISDPFLNTLPSTFNLIIDNASNLYVTSATKIYQMPSQGVFNQVTVPWDTVSVDITKLFIAFDINNKMVVNTSGNEFCTECGVYRYNGANWEFLSSPNIINPNTPTSGLELLYDSIPVVRTNYTYTVGYFGDMGYYAYNQNNLNNDEIVSNKELMCYPNPVEDNLFIFSEVYDGEFELSNSNGQIIIDGFLEKNNQKTINLSNLNSGVYFLKFYQNNSLIMKKIIKL